MKKTVGYRLSIRKSITSLAVPNNCWIIEPIRQSRYILTFISIYLMTNIELLSVAPAIRDTN